MKGAAHTSSTGLRCTVYGLLFGLPAGCLLMAVIMGLARDRREREREMLFGDIVIRTASRRDVQSGFPQELLLRKSRRAFLYASRTREGAVSDMCLLDGAERIMVTLKPSNRPGHWRDLSYGLIEKGVRTGWHYRDIDFDGSFDVKLAYDQAGTLRSSYICSDDLWKEVDRIEGRRAFSGTEVFSFDSGGMWILASSSKE